MFHQTLAKRFVETVEKAGGSVEERHAQTGTIYITVRSEEGSLKVRFADHGECYCREDVSVDPDGATYEQALEAVERRCGLQFPRVWAALKAAATKRAKDRAEREARLAPKLEALAKAEAARKALASKWIADHYPNFSDLPSKKKARIRNKANRAARAQI